FGIGLAMRRALQSCLRLACALRPRRPTFGQVAIALSLLALVALSYLGGAAAMYFRLPSSEFLTKAFKGAQDWFAPPEAPSLPASGDLTKATVTLDRPGEAWDGFTLLTTTQAPEAMLLDMRGRVVHRWKMSSPQPWDSKGPGPVPPPDA